MPASAARTCLPRLSDHRFAILVYQGRGAKSSRWIAEQVKVGDHFVDKQRPAISVGNVPNSNGHATANRTGKDGKKYKAKKKPAAIQAAPESPEPVADQEPEEQAAPETNVPSKHRVSPDRGLSNAVFLAELQRGSWNWVTVTQFQFRRVLITLGLSAFLLLLQIPFSSQVALLLLGQIAAGELVMDHPGDGMTTA